VGKIAGKVALAISSLQAILPTLVWGSFCQMLFYDVARMFSHFCGWFSFFVRPEGRFSVPTCLAPVTSRAAAVKDGRRRAGCHELVVARPRLDGGEHGVTLILVGTVTIIAPWRRASTGSPTI
jgi:hypothetical protein